MAGGASVEEQKRAVPDGGDDGGDGAIYAAVLTDQTPF